MYHSFLPSNLSDGIDVVTRDANAITAWASRNGLSLNVKKAKVMLMGSQIYTSRFDLSAIPRVRILDKPLEYGTAVKTLGVWLTPTLNWKMHVSQVFRGVHCALYSLKHYKHALSRQIKKELIESLVFPHFNYGCAIYHNPDDTKTLKLQRAHNACVRFVYGNIGRQKHVTPYR